MDDAESYLKDPDAADDELPTLASIAYHLVDDMGEETEERNWMARQPEGFRNLLTRIETCPSLEALTPVQQEILARALSHDRAGVAWRWYRPGKARLQATHSLSPQVLWSLQELQRVPDAALPCFSAYLYRLQHNGLASLPSHE